MGETNLSRVSGGCIGSYVSVASLPAHLRMTVSNSSVYKTDSAWHTRLTGLSSRVLLFEFGDIVDPAVENDPIDSSVQWNVNIVAGKLSGG